jgi:hypothetical protein
MPLVAELATAFLDPSSKGLVFSTGVVNTADMPVAIIAVVGTWRKHLSKRRGRERKDGWKPQQWADDYWSQRRNYCVCKLAASEGSGVRMAGAIMSLSFSGMIALSLPHHSKR